jgi:hypothetical protein
MTLTDPAEREPGQVHQVLAMDGIQNRRVARDQPTDLRMDSGLTPIGASAAREST